MQVERLQLDITTQIQEFYNWLKDNTLKATEISLWHGLLNIAREAGYPVWLSVAVTRLERLTGMKKDALYNARGRLQEKGLIEIRTGTGNQAAQYRIIPFGYQEEMKESTETQSMEENEDIKEVEEIETPPDTKEEEQPIKIFRKTQEIIPMPPSKDIHRIQEFLEEGMEDKLLCEAVDITLNNEELKNKSPMDRWKYFKGIVRTWYNNKISTYEEYKKHEKEREERLKGGGTKQSDRNKQSDQEQAPKENGMREFRIPGQ